jgi:hypothetical protein
MRRPAKLTRSSVVALWLMGLLAGMGGVCFAAPIPPADALDAASCRALVRSAAAKEAATAKDDTTKHMFRSRKQTPQGSQTRLYAETQQAMVGMTVAYNDKPLTPEQKKDEENRLMETVNNPELLKHKHSQEQENTEHTLRIVKALPEAFLYDYDGEQEGSAGLGRPGVRLVRLKFRPNPGYQPPSRVEQVLAGMKGVVVIDPVERRIAKIDGVLFKEVSFGWGILGHLDRGGHFLVQQCDAGHDSWEISRMSLEFTGKILLFKSLSLKSDEVFDDFRSVPSDTTFAQGVQILKAEEVKWATNRSSGTVESESRSH